MVFPSPFSELAAMMKKILFALPILLLWALSSSLLAGQPRALLDRFAEGLESLSGGFSQITVDADGRILDQSEGQLYYLAPDRFRWSYQSPFPQELVADGERLWHFDESLDQVTVRDQPPAAESPLMVLTSPALLDRFYRLDGGDEADVLRFRPLADEAEFEHASLFFSDGLPVALELLDGFGQLTRLELHELVRNPEIDPAMFNFVIPAGVDVLEGY
jgi:outer membrane lipoprotein carrier protein